MASTDQTTEGDLSLRGKPCYIDNDKGSDEPPADGSPTRPYKSLLHAYIQNIDNPTKEYLVWTVEKDSAVEPAWKEPSKSAVKKAVPLLAKHKLKLEKQTAEEEENRKKRETALEEGSKIILKEDSSLPAATRITLFNKDVKLGDGHEKGARVKVCGRIHRFRPQKNAMFMTLTDGYGQLQCVIPGGDLTRTRDALLFANGTALAVYGELRKVPENHHAPDNRELHVDFYRVIGAAPSDVDSLTTKISASQNQWDPAMLDNRHLVLRGENASALMKLRATVELAFVDVYRKMNFTKVAPPALVQTQVEGGATLFKVPYYDESAYLSQSNQLYLESVIAGLGNVYAIEKSFRAEKSLTRRHLSEFTHIEGELDFIEFEDLLNHLEELICAVIDDVLSQPETAQYIKTVNPEFEKPSRPFMRMQYTDAIDWLNAQDPPILNEEDKPHTFGDDIAEAAERKMTDKINRPILLTHFPADLKAFYMKKVPDNPKLTESVDLLMPGVGEIVGASMRMEGYQELLDAFQKHGLNAANYYWYSDTRK